MHDFVVAITDFAIQGILFAFPTFGMSIALRYGGFPDLTIEGSFSLGAAVSMVFAQMDLPLLGSFLGVLVGAMAGMLTGGVFVAAKTGKLLAGIIGMVIAQSVAILLMGATSSVPASSTLFGIVNILDSNLTVRVFGVGSGLTWEATALLFLFSLYFFLAFALVKLSRSRIGLVIRSLGRHADLLERQGFVLWRPFVLTLVCANSLAAVGGVLFAQHQHGFDTSLGFGTLVTALIGMILGEEVLRRLSKHLDFSPAARAVASPVGAVLYMGIVLLVAEVVLGTGLSEASPNSRRLITGLVLVGVLLVRRNPVLLTEED